MNERIEWVEPEEATHERREQARGDVRQLGRLILGYALPTVALVVSALLILGVNPEEVLESVLQGLALTLFIFAVVGVALRLEPAPQARACRFEANDKPLWKHARSFEIADHSTLPGLRTLTVQRSTEPRRVEACFRAGRLDEAELRAFVEARLAEARTERLMRRVKQ